MLRILLLLLAVWVALAVVGWIVEALFWLGVAAGLVVVVTAALGVARRW